VTESQPVNFNIWAIFKSLYKITHILCSPIHRTDFRNVGYLYFLRHALAWRIVKSSKNRL